jgi:hypothetical protein
MRVGLRVFRLVVVVVCLFVGCTRLDSTRCWFRSTYYTVTRFKTLTFSSPFVVWTVAAAVASIGHSEELPQRAVDVLGGPGPCVWPARLRYCGYISHNLHRSQSRVVGPFAALHCPPSPLPMCTHAHFSYPYNTVFRYCSAALRCTAARAARGNSHHGIRRCAIQMQLAPPRRVA